MLLDAGADPNVVDTEAGMGALYAVVDMHRLAVGHGRPNPKPVGLMSGVDLAKKLLAKGADPNLRLKKAIMQRHHTAGDSALGEGATPFLRAAKSGDIEMMRALVAGGADPKIAMPNGANALFFAAGQGWRNGSPAAPSYDQGSDEEAVEAIRFLLGLGFDIHATNDTGDTRAPRRHFRTRIGSHHRVPRRPGGRPRNEEQARPDSAGPGHHQGQRRHHKLAARRTMMMVCSSLLS